MVSHTLFIMVVARNSAYVLEPTVISDLPSPLISDVRQERGDTIAKV
jgi:hypothetical protein